MSDELVTRDGLHVTLREYIEVILDEREKALRLTAANLEHRLETLNTLRSEVMKDRELFLNRSDYEHRHSSLIERIDKLEKMHSKIIGVSIALIALAGLIGATISHLIK